MTAFDEGRARGLRDALAMCRMLLYERRGHGGPWPQGSKVARGAHEMADALALRISVELAAVELGGTAVLTNV